MKKNHKLVSFDKRESSTVSMKESHKEQQQVIFRRRRLTIMFIVAFGVFSLIGINLFRNGQHLLALQDTRVEVQKEQSDVDKNKKALKHEVDLLTDDEYVEKLARSKYFYSKENEQVYSIPDLHGSN